MCIRDTVGSINWPSRSGSEDEDGPNFICCVDGWQPEINEVWTFREDGVTSEVHLTSRVDVRAFVGECFATKYFTPTWCRIPMLGRKTINVSVKWIGVPNFLRTDGPPWTLNLLSPYSNWVDRGSSTSPNLVSGYGGVFRRCFYQMELSCLWPSNLPPEDLWEHSQCCTLRSWQSPYQEPHVLHAKPFHLSQPHLRLFG